MLKALSSDKKASVYAFCLPIPTHIDTTTDSTMYHLLSLIQASLEAAGLHTRHHLGASLGMHKHRYLQVNTVSSPESLQTNNRILKTEDERSICIVSDQLSNSFEHFWLVTLPHMNDIISISTYKELQSC